MQTYNKGYNACLSNSNNQSKSGKSFDNETLQIQSYWTPNNVTGNYHIILEGVDSTLKVGNNGLKACINGGNDHLILCHPITNIPQGKSNTVDAGYFWTGPKVIRHRYWAVPMLNLME